MEKKCNSCEETKPLSEFNKQKGGKLGVKATCRVCQKEKDRLYREKNRDKIRERGKEKYRQDIEKSRQQARIRAKRHYDKDPIPLQTKKRAKGFLNTNNGETKTKKS